MASYQPSESQQVIVLGDSTVENKCPLIKDIWKASESSPLLSRFLQRAISIIQEETQQLNSSEGSLFLHCINVLEIAEAYAYTDEPDEIIASALVLVARFGVLVLDAEYNAGSRPSSNTIHILGFCTGLLPGAVAACAKDAEAIFTLACEVLAISFRLIISLVRRSVATEPEPGLWATTMVGISRQDLQTELKQFNENESLPAEKQAFIGVASQSWNTVFAPPSVIEKISNKCPSLSDISQIRTTAAMAVHAPHLTRPDVDWIIGNSPSLDIPILPNASIISTSTGKPFLATTLRGLLPLIIADISTNLLDIDRTIQSVSLQLNKSKPVKILAIGPSPNIPAVARELARARFKVETSTVLSSGQQHRLVPQGKMSLGSRRMLDGHSRRTITGFANVGLR